ncbi:MAG: hypothetical protein H0W83_17360, partial [Planctomycetes bacterium]|nr:hypothetical protein [Planctomycetota bacterium]
MRTWPTRVGTVLQLMDPTVAPKLLLERLWMEVARWSTIGGIWLQTRPGHIAPSGTYVAGEPPADADEIAALATNATAPI